MQIQCTVAELKNLINGPASASTSSGKVAHTFLKFEAVSQDEIAVIGMSPVYYIKQAGRVGRVSFTPARTTAFANAKKLSQILSTFADSDAVEIDANNQSFIFQNGKCRFKLAGLTARDFDSCIPCEDASPILGSIEIPAKSLIDAFQNTQYATASAPCVGNQPAFDRLWFELNNGDVSFVGCDGHRMSYFSAANTNTGANFRVVVDKGIFTTLKSAVLLEGPDVKVSIRQHSLEMQVGSTYIFAQLLAGVIPNWKAVLPVIENAQTSIKINKQSLLEALRPAHSLLNGSRRVRFEADDKLLKLTNGGRVLNASKVGTEDLEEIEMEIPAIMSGSPIDSEWDSRYLLEGISHCEGEELSLYLFNSGKSMLVTGSNPTKHLHLLMGVTV